MNHHPLAAVLLLGLSLSATAAPPSLSSPGAAPLIEMAPAQREALGIRTADIESVASAWSGTYPAKVVVPNAQLRIVSAPQSGLLTVLLVAEGEAVNEGQTLAVIRSPQLVEQQGQYLEALTSHELASVELERDRKLVKEGIIAKRRFLEARARHQQAGTLVEQRRQSLQLAGMDANALETLTRERRLTSALEVRAPLNGVVLEQLGTPGQRLEMASPLYRIAKLKPLWLEVHVPLESLGTTRPGIRVQVDAPRVEGEVITIGSMIHSEDQGVLVRSRIDAGAERLRPGQFVQARLAVAEGSGRFRIPRNALVRNAGRSWVFAAGDKGFRPLPVTVVNAEQNHLVVTGELTTDTRIAIAGTAALKAAWLEGVE
jgi:RND family efflux transporter MFP subunit